MTVGAAGGGDAEPPVARLTIIVGAEPDADVVSPDGAGLGGEATICVS